MSGGDHFIKSDNNPPGLAYCPHCGEMVAEDDWPIHSMNAVRQYQKKIAGLNSALVKANDALRFLYGHDLGEALDMTVQEAFTATSVALADNVSETATA